MYFAHSSPNREDQPPNNWQPLREHLAGVASQAKALAEATRVDGLPAAAEAAGWLHDLGKYRASFDRYIRGLPPIGPKGHKQAGAVRADEAKNLPLTVAILGHHGGMTDAGPNGGDVPQEVECEDNGRPVLEEVWDIAIGECPELNALELPEHDAETAETDLFTRLLFSCLVDADWSDTGEHERRVKGWPEFPLPPDLKPGERLKRLLGYIEGRAMCARDPNVAARRKEVLDACLNAATKPTGLFSLTVPTGGGKTLSGLAFALQHAATHELRRVIYVAPYISILEQNADVIRAALGVSGRDLDVFEHQSLAEPQGPHAADEKQTSASARRAENWDAPVVVTTNVQFFESLFSHRPGRCRKLHNIARSVVVLDECQSLPPDLVKPTCQMLKQLVNQLGCTVVLCTATQPAFAHDCLRDTTGDHRLTATEIIPKELDLFAALKRVQLKWPVNRDARLSWAEVAERMTANASALCIVNTKKAALDLFAELKICSHHVFHLSTNMCPAHRTAVLAEVKRRLDAKKNALVVSTSLIEAGVDIDFPCVFREMAPLESIVQAAGRCNREGLIPDAGGQVIIFRSEEGKIPKGWYEKGRNVLEAEFLADSKTKPPEIDQPGDILDYFNRLYWKGDLDPQNIVGMRAGLKFRSVAESYRLISDDTVPVVVATWADHAAEIERLLAQLRERPVRANFRALAQFQVNVFRHQWETLGRHVEEWQEPEVRIWRGKYESEIGLVAEGPDELIV